MELKNKIEMQLKEMVKINNDIEKIINHKNRYLLDSIIVDYLISQRNKLETGINITRYSLNSTDETILKSIFNSNLIFNLDFLKSHIEFYNNLLDKKFQN